jgi:nucleoside-diphosphate-sugar epimerase
LNFTRLIPKTIYGVIADAAPEIYGDGNQTREWIYIDDVVYGYLALADVPAGAYNFGGDEMTVRGIIQIIRGFTGAKESVHIGEGKQEIYSQHIDDSKMREYGWSRKTTLTEGIRQTIDGIYEKEMKRAYR